MAIGETNRRRNAQLSGNFMMISREEPAAGLRPDLKMFEQNKCGASPHRVLFVSPEDAWSAATIQLAHFATWLAQRDWEIAIATLKEGTAADFFRAKGLNVLFESQFLIDHECAALRATIPRFDLVVANTIAAFRAVQAAQ